MAESLTGSKPQDLLKHETLVVLPSTPSTPSKPKGYLIVIGGGEIPDSILKKMLELCTQAHLTQAQSSEEPPSQLHSSIVILPMASESPLETALIQKEKFELLGAMQVEIINPSEKDKDAEEHLTKLKQATGVFFCGGDQKKLTSSLMGTKILKEVQQVYQRGGVIAGTSAGAAVMSKIMLTGESRIPIDPALPFRLIQSKNVHTAEGFGFLETTIIDQHFSRRGRHNRLLSLVLEHPQLLGIGIDEETAIIVSPEKMIEVAGNSHIFIFDATLAKDIRVNDQQNMSASYIQLHLLCANDRYDLTERRVFSSTPESS